MRRSLLFFVSIVAICNLQAQNVYLNPYKKISTGTKAVSAIAFSSSSKWFASANGQGEIYISGVDDATPLARIPGADENITLDFIDQDQTLLALDKSGKLTRFNMSNKESSVQQTTKGVKLASLDPNHQYLSILNKESVVEILDLKANMTFGRIPPVPASQKGMFMGFDRFGQQLAVINNIGETVTWNIQNQQLLRQLKLQSGEYANSRSVIHSASTNAGGDHFIIGLQEVFIPKGGMQGRNQPERRNMLISYDWLSGQEYKRVPLRFRGDGIAMGQGYAAMFSTDSKTINMLNIERGEISSSVAVDEKPSAIALSDDNTLLAVGTVAGNVYLFEVIRNNPSEIKITKPSMSRNVGDHIVTDNKINLEGSIEGTGTVSRIMVNGQPAKGSIGSQFSHDVELVPGKNRIKIEVENTDRSITEKDIYLTYEPKATGNKGAPVVHKFQGRRLALVIGNANYSAAAKLTNTANDAKAMEAVLKEMNFEVITVVDGTYEAMKTAIYTFGDRIQDVDVSIFYYAGHGLEVDGTNYLVPTDANITSALDVKLKTIPLTGVIRTMEFANDEGLNMIILDACRNNPFPTGKRSGGSGLARVQAPSGTLIAYATDPGSTASDGDKTNGLYTGELVKQMKVSQRIEDIFMNTRNQVEHLSNGAQRPWEEARLKGVFFLK
ncbi:MAG TPA: caspase family protein [Cyclobacteriaceae bacterium]|nr:caspase family protein [Cyclobacteriaceae bacterium]